MSSGRRRSEDRGRRTVKQRSGMSGQNPYTLNLYRKPRFYAMRSALCAMLKIQYPPGNIQCPNKKIEKLAVLSLEIGFECWVLDIESKIE